MGGEARRNPVLARSCPRARLPGEGHEERTGPGTPDDGIGPAGARTGTCRVGNAIRADDDDNEAVDDGAGVLTAISGLSCEPPPSDKVLLDPDPELSSAR